MNEHRWWGMRFAVWTYVVWTIAACMGSMGCHRGGMKLDDQTVPADSETGFVPKVIELDGETYRYAVYVPQAYTPSRSWPAILFLHGAGERGTDGLHHTQVGIGKIIREHTDRFACLVVMPQLPSGEKWQGPMAKLALETLDSTVAEYNIDERRIVLTGLSLGGYGTWLIGAEHSDRFSCLVPICGAGDVANAKRLARLPIWCFHGDADPVVSVQGSRTMVDAVRAAGGDVRYTEFPGVGHNSWDPAYEDPEVIAWMLAQSRSAQSPGQACPGL